MTRSNTILAIFVATILLVLLAFGLSQDSSAPGDVRTRVVHEMAATLNGALGASQLDVPAVTPAQMRLMLLCAAAALLVLAGVYVACAGRRDRADNRRS